MLNKLIHKGLVENNIKGIGASSIAESISNSIIEYLNNAEYDIEVFGEPTNGIAYGHFEALNNNDFMYCLNDKTFDKNLAIWNIFKGVGEGLNKYLIDYRIERPVYNSGMGYGKISGNVKFKLSDEINLVLSKGFVKYMESRKIIFEVYH